MAERPNAVVLKTIVLQGTLGSNPSPSAVNDQHFHEGCWSFVFWPLATNIEHVFPS